MIILAVILSIIFLKKNYIESMESNDIIVFICITMCKTIGLGRESLPLFSNPEVNNGEPYSCLELTPSPQKYLGVGLQSLSWSLFVYMDYRLSQLTLSDKQLPNMYLEIKQSNLKMNYTV